MSLLQKISLICRCSNGSNTPVHTENGSDGYIYINISTSIQRIKKANIFRAAAYIIIERHQFIQLFAADTGTTDAMLKNTHELVICKRIKFLHILSLHVHGTCISKNIGKACFIHFNVDSFGSKPDVPEQA